MSRVELNPIRQAADTGVNALVQRRRQFGLLVLSEKIRAAQRAYENEVAAEQRQRLAAAAFLVYQETQMLRSMARSVNSRNTQIASGKLISVSDSW